MMPENQPLTDQLNWVPVEVEPQTTVGVAAPEDLLFEKPDAIQAKYELNEAPLNTVATTKKQSAHEAGTIAAKKFVDAVKAGADPEEAAKEMGIPPDLWNKVKGQVSHKLSMFHFGPALRRELVRARLNEILLMGDYDQSMKAAAQIAKDPSVGLENTVTGGQTIQIGALKQILEAVRSESPKLLGDGREKSLDIVDVHDG